MKSTNRYFTKSLFTTALTCPTKLYYHGKRDEYAVKEDDAFLEELAEGGLQVGELAKCYYPGGTKIEARGHEEAVRQTRELLKQQNAVIFEAAVMFDRFFVRTDILKKEGNKLHLIEVKAKSIDPGDPKKGFDKSQWKDYIADVAFQAWIMEQAFPEFEVVPYLMLADKSKIATVNGLNQRFRVNEINGGYEVERKFDNITPEMLGNKILTEFPVKEHVDKMIKEGVEIDSNVIRPLGELAREYADYYRDDRQYPIHIQKKKCKECEYRLNGESAAKGLKSGYEECMAKTFAGFDPDEPTVMDIWNFRDTDELFKDGIYEMKDAHNYLLERLEEKKGEKTGTIERQLLQVRKTCLERDGKEDVKRELFNKMSQWRLPLHFIDFETHKAAIPFIAGIHPYEQIAFQFSCHTLYEDGEVRHHEWIGKEQGRFPNFEFIEALKDVLDKDNGTIFRYSHHENTVLREIHSQLDRIKPDVIDYIVFMGWIDTMTEWDESIEVEGKNKKKRRTGGRNMVDMCEMVQKYYYHPDMGGSNSIKDVLPAVLSVSGFLRNKYGKPLDFGTNLKGKVWQRLDKASGNAVDPYKLLVSNFDDNTDRDVINNGGAAMAAFGKMQYSNISEKVRNEIICDLLRYCELDTLAMLMIYEHWESLKKRTV